MGCSNPHPHCQAWATSWVPRAPGAQAAAQRAYLETHGRDLLGDYLDRGAPRRGAPRLLATPIGPASCLSGRSGPSRPCSPDAPREDLPALGDEERDALADILKRLNRPLREPLPHVVPVLHGLARPAQRWRESSLLPPPRGLLAAPAALGHGPQVSRRLRA